MRLGAGKALAREHLTRERGPKPSPLDDAYEHAAWLSELDRVIALLRRVYDAARAEERAHIRSKLIVLANEYGDRLCYCEADALMNASDDLAPPPDGL